MTQVASGPDVPSAAPAVDPAAAPAAAPPAPAATPQAEEMIQVQRSQFAPWNGDTHEAARRAGYYDEGVQSGLYELNDLCKQFEMTPRQLIEALNPPPEAAPAPAGEFPPPPPGAPGLTIEAVESLMERRDAARTMRERQERDTQDRLSAWDIEKAAIGQALKDKFNVTAEHPRYRYYNAMLGSEIQATLEASLPPHLSEEARSEMLNSPAGKQVIADAVESFVSSTKDMNLQAVTDFANGQSNVPGAALDGSGAGGGQCGRDFPGLSVEDQMKAVTGEIPEDQIIPG